MFIMNNSSYRLSEINILNNLRHFYHIKTTGWHIRNSSGVVYFHAKAFWELTSGMAFVHKFHVSAIKYPKKQTRMF